MASSTSTSSSSSCMPTISLDHLEKELKKRQKSSRRASLVGFVKRTVGRRFSSGASASTTKPPLTKSTSSRTYQDESSLSEVEEGEQRLRFFRSKEFDGAPVSREIPPSKQCVKLFDKGDLSKVFYTKDELMSFHEKATETMKKLDKEEDAADNEDDPALPNNVLQQTLDACKRHAETFPQETDDSSTSASCLSPELSSHWIQLYKSSKKTLLGLEHNYSPFLEQERAQNQVNMDHLVHTLQEMAKELSMSWDKWSPVLAKECVQHSRASRVFAHQHALALAEACQQEHAQDEAKQAAKKKKKALKKDSSKRKLKKDESKRKVSSSKSHSNSNSRSQSTGRAARSQSRSRSTGRARSVSRTRSSNSTTSDNNKHKSRKG